VATVGFKGRMTKVNGITWLSTLLSSSYICSFDIYCRTPAWYEFALNTLINSEVLILDKIFCHTVLIFVIVVVVVVVIVSVVTVNVNITVTAVVCYRVSTFQRSVGHCLFFVSGSPPGPLCQLGCTGWGFYPIPDSGLLFGNLSVPDWEQLFTVQ
jgi:hypothetical protein